MQNTINLHNSGNFYTATHQGKTYQCARVSDIIQSTSETPIYLKRWMVNCGIEVLLEPDIIPHLVTFPLNEKSEKTIKKLAWQAHQNKSQQALDVGNKVHRWIKHNAIDETGAYDESRACWNAYQAFVAQYMPVTIASEIALYDLKGLFAGTCDKICLLGATSGISAQKKTTQHSSQYPVSIKRNTVYILDWKTSKAINEQYKMQVTVYKHMIICLIKEFKKYPSRFNESTTRILNAIILAAGKKLKIVCGIVRLPKRPSARRSFEFVEVTAKEEKMYLREFVLMAKLHNLRKVKETMDGNANGFSK